MKLNDNSNDIICLDSRFYPIGNLDSSIKFYKTYGGTGCIGPGEPRYTSVEVYCDKSEVIPRWKIKTVHKFFSTQLTIKNTSCELELSEEIDNPEAIFAELKAMDLSKYDEDYIERDGIKRYLGTWGIEYNQGKKIVGSANVEIDEVERIKTLLNFDQKEREMMMIVLNRFDNLQYRDIYGLRFNLLDSNLKEMSPETPSQSKDGIGFQKKYNKIQSNKKEL